jgi:hypothetical protein
MGPVADGAASSLEKVAASSDGELAAAAREALTKVRPR